LSEVATISNIGRGVALQIRIRHVSGSRAGTEQTFDARTVRLGREPSNDVAFDAHHDLLVSGRHLELGHDGQRWIARDLGSTNGTFVNGERISARPVESGEILELGRGGPRIEVRFESPLRTTTASGSIRTDRPGTKVMSVDELMGGRTASARDVLLSPGAADGTMTLDPAEMAAIRAQALEESGPPTLSVRVRGARRSSPVRIILLSALVVVALLVLLVLATHKTAPATTVADTAAAERAREVEGLKKELATREAQLQQQEAARASSTTDTNSVVSNDLERQYRESQEQVEKLRRELETKNDEVQRAQNQTPKTIIRYVPQPAAPQAPVPASRPASEAPPVQTASATPAPVVTVPAVVPSPAPAPQHPPAVAPAETPRVAVVTPEPAPAPAPVTTIAAKETPRPAPVTAAAAAPLVTAETTSASGALLAGERLVKSKTLRKRLNVAAMEAESAASGAPPSLASELARSLSATLGTSGSTFADHNAGASVRLAITSYHSTSKSNVNTGTAVDAARGIGSLFGRGSLPSAPAHARSMSYDVGIATLVTVYDNQGRQIATARPNCSLNQTRSNVALDVARVSYGDLLVGDTPPADAMRQIVAGSADAILRTAEALEPEILIRTARGDSVAIDAGRNANVGPDDIFDVVDAGRVIGRVRVDVVQDATATARVLSSSSPLLGKRLRYAGTAVAENKPAETTRSDRFGTIRAKTDIREGPGLSFKTTGSIGPDTAVRVIYTVGPWARIEYGHAAAWVPVSTLDLL
jgi:FHA domain